MTELPAPAHGPAQRFRRPTILDALILTGAAAAGLAIARAGTLAGEGGRWQSFYCAAWFATGILAGPAIIGAQYLRGRRGRLGFGEVLWLLPASLYISAALAAWCEAEDWAGWIYLGAMATHALCSLPAFVYFVVAFELRPAWTNWLGAVICLTTFVALVLSSYYGIDDAYYEWGHPNER